MLNLMHFKDRFNMRPFMISPTAIIRGVGRTLGIPLIEVEGATGYYDSNLNGKAKAAAKAFKSNQYDFGFVHVKAVDDAGHDKDHKIKVEQLEKSDRMIKTFIDEVKDDKDHDYIIIVTGDHTTPTQIGDHTFEPVPITMSAVSNILGRNKKLANLKDDVKTFDEIACGQGLDALLGRFSAINIMTTAMKYRDKFN